MQDDELRVLQSIPMCRTWSTVSLSRSLGLLGHCTTLLRDEELVVLQSIPMCSSWKYRSSPVSGGAEASRVEVSMRTKWRLLPFICCWCWPLLLASSPACRKLRKISVGTVVCKSMHWSSLCSFRLVFELLGTLRDHLALRPVVPPDTPSDDCANAVDADHDALPSFQLARI